MSKKNALRPMILAGLFSILLIALIVAVASEADTTGMASMYNQPTNECTDYCKQIRGNDFMGIGTGKYHQGFNHCICKDSGYAYRMNSWYR